MSIKASGETIMKCPQCQHEMSGPSKFCPECGTNVSALSHRSGAEAEVSVNALPTLMPGTPAEVSVGGQRTIMSPGMSPAWEGSGVALESRYELLEELGRGGFAVVHRAQDRKLGRTVAIKRLLGEMMKGGEQSVNVQRFLRESQAIAKLNHRNIIQVFDTDKDAAGYYIVMEYIAGGSLRQLLKKEEKLAPAEAIALARGVAQGLAFAHRHNLVHRDIKPANILLQQEGDERVPRITDFGLARSGVESELSITGYGMGTPAYMAPEQRRDAKNVNHTADIFAVGKMLYEMLTGEEPATIDPEAVPGPLAKVILRCTKNNPQDRYFTAEELIKDLDALPAQLGRVGAASRSASASSDPSACPSCGVRNAPDARFCGGCGQGMFLACPECDRENPVQAQFCPGCGTEIAGFQAVREAVQKIGEYRNGKKWSRVVKEATGLKESPPRLPGKKGQELLAEMAKARQEAEKKLADIENLEKRARELAAKDDLERALDAAVQWRSENPLSAEAEKLIGELRIRLEAREWQKAEEKARDLTRQELFTKAVAAVEGFLGVYPDGAHAAEAQALVAKLGISLEAWAWQEAEATAQDLVNQGRFEDALAPVRTFMLAYTNGKNFPAAQSLASVEIPLARMINEFEQGCRKALDLETEKLLQAAAQAVKATKIPEWPQGAPELVPSWRQRSRERFDAARKSLVEVSARVEQGVQEANALWNDLQSAISGGHWEQAGILASQVEALCKDRPGVAEARLKVQEQQEREKKLVETLEMLEGKLGQQIAQGLLGDARTTLERIDAVLAKVKIHPLSSLAPRWTAAQAQAARHRQDLEIRETRLPELFEKIQAAAASQDYAACLEACLEVATLADKDVLPDEIAAARQWAEKAVAEIPPALAEAQLALERRQWDEAEQFCAKVLALQGHNQEAIDLRDAARSGRNHQRQYRQAIALLVLLDSLAIATGVAIGWFLHDPLISLF